MGKWKSTVTGSDLPIKKFRSYEEIEENIIHNYLEDVFYVPYTQTFQHFTDKETQVQGIDTIMYSANTEFVIDEKAAVTYPSSTLKSFTFEINATGRNNKVFYQGITDNNRKSNYYLLTWLDKSQDYISSKDDISGITACLVSKAAVKQYLAEKGITPACLVDIAQKMIDGEIKNDVGDLKTHGYRIHKYIGEFERGKTETSVSILLPREELKRIAHTYISFSK